MAEYYEIKDVDEKYMRLCLELAEEGASRVSPNPMVGAVILDRDGNMVGLGHHKEYGGPHAEIFALREAGDNAKDGTLYINLEPCCHHGKTPPCVNAVINSGIKRVVIGMVDPNLRVAGRSVELMKAAQIEVTTGVLEKESIELNKAFYKYHTTGFPLVVSKIAMTLDGKIATRTQSSQWINSDESRMLSHHWRNRFDAIITGSSTIISDDSRLTCRIPGGRDPVRIVIDSKLRTSPDAKVYTVESLSPAILVTSFKYEGDQLKPYGKNKNVTIYKSPLTEDGKINLPNLLRYLATEHRILSIILEAGPTLNGVMLKEGLVDKYYVFVAPKIVGDKNAYSSIDGIGTLDINNAIQLHEVKTRQIGDDILIKAWVKDEFRRLNQ
ncbi:MAG: bifunctional diaminohydroxyphosphoribosylaminopyrimidine deaminase/5-amino-6-(5-phosphoribosylamino)uracil reductase RibD [Cyanobacteriota bacterium]